MAEGVQFRIENLNYRSAAKILILVYIAQHFATYILHFGLLVCHHTL